MFNVRFPAAKRFMEKLQRWGEVVGVADPHARMAELLEQTHLTNEQQEYLSAIQESGDTLLARLNDLLDLSKIESGQLDLQAVDFDLVEAVEGPLPLILKF